MPLTLCLTCKHMLYRQDACRGTGKCGRTDGGPTKSTAQPTSAAKVTTPGRTLTDRRGPPTERVRSQGPASAKAVAKNVGQSGQEADVELPVEPIIGKRRGRPQTITDMKAYKAMKAKEYRLKAKREQK